MNCIRRNLNFRIRSGLCLNVTNRTPWTRTYLAQKSPRINQYRTSALQVCHKPFIGLNLGIPSVHSDWMRCSFNIYSSRSNFLASNHSYDSVRIYSTNEGDKKEEETEKLTLFQKFKKMYRDYWYVLIPVHCGTSAVWFAGFYMLAESGVDIVGILEFFKINDQLIDPFRNGHAKMGYIAVAFALYKIATPFRYAVTLGGTTVAINYLKKMGYIKPLPKKEQLKEIILEKKDIFMEKKQQLSDNFSQQMKSPFSRLDGSKRK